MVSPEQRLTKTESKRFILNLSAEHALSVDHYRSKNLMFIVVINKKRRLLPNDSLLIRYACVLIGYDSVQAHHP